MDEVQALKAENERLNKIISVLLLQLDAKNKENTLQNFSNGTENAWNRLTNLCDGILKLSPTVTYLYEGSLSVQSRFAELCNGILKLRNTNTELVDGTLSVQSRLTQLCEGILKLQGSFTQICEGIKQMQESSPQKNEVIAPIQIRLPRITPLNIAITDSNAKVMKPHLKKHFGRVVRRKTVQAVGKEFLLLHNQQMATHDELRKISGLSTPGFAKHLPNLRKKGLVKKLAFKKYALTDVSRQILNEVFGKEPVAVG